MAEVGRFVTPEQDFGGLYRLSDRLREDKAREEQLRQQREGKYSANAKFLTDYLDSKDHLTGTYYDPQIVKGFGELLQEGMSLAQKGANTNDLVMALAPKVNKLSEYSAKAKLVNNRLKEQLAQIPVNAGYNKGLLEQEARKVAFMNDTGDLKDITEVDPSVDYITEVIKKYPDRVTTDAGIDEFVKSSPKFTSSETMKRINSRGGYEMKKAKVTAPSWMQVDESGELVPRFEVAIDGGQPIQHEFVDEKGNKTKSPVRLMNEKDFDSILSGNPAIADWVRGQVMRSGENVDITSPQAKILARAIMYDELKRRKPGSIEDVEIQKEIPAPRIYNTTNINTGGTNINDLYSRVESAADKRFQDYKSGNVEDPFVKLFESPLDEQTAILDFVNKGRKGDDAKTPEQIKIGYADDGKVWIFDAETGYKLGTLPKVGTNLKVQADVKGKRAVVADEKSPSVKTYSYNGKTFTQEQIEKAAKQSNMTVEQYIKQAGLK